MLRQNILFGYSADGVTIVVAYMFQSGSGAHVFRVAIHIFKGDHLPLAVSSGSLVNYSAALAHYSVNETVTSQLA